MRLTIISCDRCEVKAKTQEEFKLLDFATVGVTVKNFKDPGSSGQYDLVDLCTKCRAELGLARSSEKEKKEVLSVPENLVQCLEKLCEEVIKRREKHAAIG